MAHSRSILLIILLVPLASAGACVVVDDQGVSDGSDGSDGSESGDSGGPEECGGSDDPDDRHSSREITIGDAIEGCIDHEADQDWFVLTVPDDSTGGILRVALEDVEADRPRLEVFAVSDEGSIVEALADSDGGDARAFLSVAPGHGYRVMVREHVTGFEGPYRYTLTSDYTPVQDVHEPNDMRDAASPITVGEVVHGALFAGHVDGETPEYDAFDDWFTIDLQTGTTEVRLANTPEDARMRIELFDPANASVGEAHSGGPGEILTISAELLAAGTYTLEVTHFGFEYVEAAGEGDMVPDHATRSYELVVAQ